MREPVGRGIVAVCGVLVLGTTLFTGCTPDLPVVTAPPVVEVTPTPAPSPTPQWKEDEQAAIDVVYAYIDTASRIGHSPGEVDWGVINEVASDPVTGDLARLWDEWLRQGWHLVGTARFTVTSASAAKSDYRGDYYYVRGCYFAGDTHMADATGARVDGPDVDSFPGMYTVLRTHTENYFVIEETRGEGSC